MNEALKAIRQELEDKQAIAEDSIMRTRNIAERCIRQGRYYAFTEALEIIDQLNKGDV